MVSRRWLIQLVVAALLLPIVICVLAAVGRLLAGMGDATGGAVLDYLALGAGVLWLVDLIALVILLALEAVTRDEQPSDEELP
ncbi:MAG: hypothetical protein KF708_05800 [Pirellulales bacterium]|nr:hypothetical protein [Pirellulales bacterium]